MAGQAVPRLSRAEARPFCRLAQLDGMGHSDFLADAMFRAAGNPDSESMRRNARAFAWVARRTLEFLLERLDRRSLPPAVTAADADGRPVASLVSCHS